MSSIEKFINKLDKSTSKDVDKDMLYSGEYILNKGHSAAGEHTNAEPNFVEINFARLEEQGMLTPGTANKQLMEEYRAIKRPILKNAFGKGAHVIHHGNLIMISSALPGEGKTFSAINLAISMASEMDRTVLLVEADVAKPAICKYLGIAEPRKGLIDYIDNPSLGLSGVLLHTNIPKLSILPAGSYKQHVTELLVSENMQALMDELSDRYPDRIVLFDSPPLLITSEAVALSELMGQLILVVESGKTPQKDVKDALAKLNHDSVVGILLNKFEGKARQNYGGYYGSGSQGNYGNYGYGGGGE